MISIPLMGVCDEALDKAKINIKMEATKVKENLTERERDSIDKLIKFDPMSKKTGKDVSFTVNPCALNPAICGKPVRNK